MQLATFASVDALPPACLGLIGSDPLGGAGWYRTVVDHALPPSSEPCFAVVTDAGRPCAVMPLLRHEGGRWLSSMTTPYTCLFQPVLGAFGESASQQAAARQIGMLFRRWGTVRIDAVAAEWEGLAPFTAGLRSAGLVVQPFDHFGNWHEPISERSWDAYLGERPSDLRNTVRRKLRAAAGVADFDVVRGGDKLGAAIAAYEAVYRASWKEPEPYPGFNPALIREAARTGTLRLGVLRVDGRPAAVQFWVVADGCATVLKLAHDEAFKRLSPGTVLTAMMIRGLVDEERVQELDFGRGDDPYKAAWTTQRRQRIGLMVMNPWRPSGLVAAVRSLAGRLLSARPA